ncbi:MAG TPA: ATP-binding protein, partial [Allocoleopsis sp.]
MSEEQFRRAFDEAPIGVSLVSMTGQFVKVNARYCDLLGYTEAELLTLTFQEITHPADLEADLKEFRRMLAGEIDSSQLEKRYIAKDGTSIPVLINVALIHDHNGQPLYSVGHVQDIRDRLKVQRMKDEFISVISHELRTPLTSIQGALDLLGSGIYNNRPEKASHMLKIAINNSARLVRLVNDILTLERLESGKVQLVMEQCPIGDLMQQAVEGIQSIADQSSITLCYTPLSVNLWAAPDAIIQALTNLLSNAIKFSSPGDTVWLKAALQSSLPSPYILFTVKDQGRGIPEDKLEIIFEQFQQVDVSDSSQKGGTGLGLAICKSIVQQHGGQIWVESIFGEGSTFYIALPMNEKEIG